MRKAKPNGSRRIYLNMPAFNEKSLLQRKPAAQCSRDHYDPLELLPTPLPSSPAVDDGLKIMSSPYPFANSAASGSSSRPPVQPSAGPQTSQSNLYAQPASNGTSTTSLLPPSARGQQTVQATFAQGPKQALRGTPSTSNLVRAPLVRRVPQSHRPIM